MYKASVQGQSVVTLIESLVNQAISKLPIPKAMRWGSSTIQFIRPVHTVTALYGAEWVHSGTRMRHLLLNAVPSLAVFKERLCQG